MRTPLPNRLMEVDIVRGLAMLWMTDFHFCFDLQYFGYIHTNFYANPFWTMQRTAIVSLFLLCAGFGQAAAIRSGTTWTHFWRRWRRIAAAALLVTAASRAMFPQSFIYFGVLQGIAVMLILARLCAGLGLWLWPLGALALYLPELALPLHAHWARAVWLDTRALNWLGLISHKPITEDYVPVFPWLGAMLWGLAGGQWWLARQTQTHAHTGTPALHSVPARALAQLGRHSLPYYLIHQPVMIAALTIASRFISPG